MPTASRLSSPLLKLSLIAFMMTSYTLRGPTEAHAQTLVIETADGLADLVGQSTSLALDASGNPHVSYFDVASNDLKYARKSAGVWTIETADGSSNVVGLYTSLALDASGNPHVSYQNFTFGDLRYARKSGGEWTIETADGSSNVVGLYTSLALDASGNPHVSYYDVTTDNLKYARKSGGVWTIETADGSVTSVGLYTSLALDASGNPHVSYQDATRGDLEYARKTGGVWTRETVDGSASDVGSHTSLALDASGNPHVSYYDATAGDLKYARKSGGVWTRETADGSANDVGQYTSLVLDASGNSHVSYLDGTTVDLKYARKSGGVWTIETTDGSANSAGYYTSLAFDASGNPHVSYYDDETTDLKYAYIPSILIASPQRGVTWAVGSEQTIRWSFTGGLPIDNSDVYLSVDGGTTFTQIRNEARDPEMMLRVPHSPTRFASIKIIRPSPYTEAYMDSFFTIDATITLAKFDATRDAIGDGTRLTWETRPGPEADIRYRVERASGDADVFSPIHGDLLDVGEITDTAPAASSRYRLIAVNGLGEEYVLGETSVVPALAADRDIVAYPNPASGPIEILYRVPLDRSLDLTIYDTSGRRVRSLVAGRQPVGVQSVTWDRRDESARDVAAGTYFARLTSGGGFTATERITVVR